MQRTYRYRLYPNKGQEQTLLWTMRQCRFVYNMMLEGLRKQEKPDRYVLQKSLPKLKERYPHLKGVYAKALQHEVYRLFSNLKALSQSKKKGRCVGKLRFKSIAGFKTIHYNQSGFKILETGKRLDILHISKVGELPMMMHRLVEGNIKQIVIKHHLSGKWYACIIAEQNDDIVKQPIKKAVGIDVGIKYYCSDSNGLQFENPKYLNKSLKQLKRRQQKLSKTKKGSKNRGKQCIIVARQHERIENQRNDFLHKLSRYYTNRYDLIAVEDLNIKNMVRNHHLARHISDASWNKFAQIVSYKAESAGKTLVCVNPRGTSQEYNHGEGIDRDYNASLNILQRGLEKVGLGLPEFTPADIGHLQKLQFVPASLVVETGSHFQNL